MVSTSRLLAVGTLLLIGFSPIHIQSKIATQIQAHAPSQISSVWYQQDDQKLAVTEADYDDIGKILDSLGIAHASIQNADLDNYDFIEQFDVIFINCSLQAMTYSDAASKSLEKFVSTGGKLYASDFAFVYVDRAFPGYLNFFNDNPYNGLGDQTVTADIIDLGLQEELNSQTVDIHFDLRGWVPIESVSDSVHIVLSGDFETANGETLTDKPLSVSFPYGDGYVLYTSYHSEVSDLPVTHEQQTLLQYLVRAAVEPEILASPIPTVTPNAENPDSSKGLPVYIIVLVSLFCTLLIFVVAAVVGFLVIRTRRKNSAV